MIIRMTKEEEQTDLEAVKECRSRAVEALVKYLEKYYRETTSSDSKHSLMGPVGKLLTRITTTGDINWGAVKGYILSTHKNMQGDRAVSADAVERLDAAVGILEELRSMLPPTKWLKTIEDIDDEVYFHVFKKKLVAQCKGESD